MTYPIRCILNEANLKSILCAKIAMFYTNHYLSYVSNITWNLLLADILLIPFKKCTIIITASQQQKTFTPSQSIAFYYKKPVTSFSTPL